MNRGRWLVAGGITVLVLTGVLVAVFSVSSSEVERSTYQPPATPAPVSATDIIERDYNELVAQSIKNQTESYAKMVDPDVNLQDMTVTKVSAENW
jgi:hypothetical protein